MIFGERIGEVKEGFSVPDERRPEEGVAAQVCFSITCLFLSFSQGSIIFLCILGFYFGA